MRGHLLISPCSLILCQGNPNNHVHVSETVNVQSMNQLNWYIGMLSGLEEPSCMKGAIWQHLK